MYTIRHYPKTMMEVNEQEEGEPIEVKVMRLLVDKEPIKDGAPLIFTEKKDGVNAAYNIRTDRFEIAIDALDRVRKSKAAARDELPLGDEEAKVIDINKKDDGKPESTQGKQSQK